MTIESNLVNIKNTPPNGIVGIMPGGRNTRTITLDGQGGWKETITINKLEPEKFKIPVIVVAGGNKEVVSDFEI